MNVLPKKLFLIRDRGPQNPRLTFVLRLNAAMEMIYDSKEAVGGGADRDTRGRVCSQKLRVRFLGEDFGVRIGLDGEGDVRLRLAHV